MQHQSRKKMARKNDEYYTQPSSWDLVLQYIPKNKVLFEPFFGAGHTAKYFNQHGYKMIGENTLDFFDTTKMDHFLARSNIIISNPPFSKKYKIIKKLVEYNKPFMLILPLACINTISFRQCFNNQTKDITLIIPKGRLKFIQDGKVKKSPSFESCFLCYKMMDDKIIWL